MVRAAKKADHGSGDDVEDLWRRCWTSNIVFGVKDKVRVAFFGSEGGAPTERWFK